MEYAWVFIFQEWRAHAEVELQKNSSARFPTTGRNHTYSPSCASTTSDDAIEKVGVTYHTDNVDRGERAEGCGNPIASGEVGSRIQFRTALPSSQVVVLYLESEAFSRQVRDLSPLSVFAQEILNITNSELFARFEIMPATKPKHSQGNKVMKTARCS